MRKVTVLAVFLLFPFGAQAEPQKITSVEEIVRSNIESCKATGLKRGDDPDSVSSFCTCTGKVFEDNFTIADYREMEKAGSENKNIMELPQFKRIQPKLQACKKGEKKKLSQKDRISFIKFKEFASNVDVPVKVEGKASATIALIKDESTMLWSASIRRNNQNPVTLKDHFEGMWIEEIGTIDLDASGNEEVFVVLQDQGSGGGSTYLNLVSVRSLAVVGLSIFNLSDPPTTDQVSTTGNFNDPKFRKESDFLNKIKREYFEDYVQAERRKKYKK